MLVYEPTPDPYRCACGFDRHTLEEVRDNPGWTHLRRSLSAHHRARHKKFEEGVPLRAKALQHLVKEASSSSKGGGHIVRVAGAGASEHEPLPRLARKMALVASGGRGWGTSTYYPGDASTDAYLYIHANGVAVGYLAVKTVRVWGRLDTREVVEGELPCAYQPDL